MQFFFIIVFFILFILLAFIIIKLTNLKLTNLKYGNNLKYGGNLIYEKNNEKNIDLTYSIIGEDNGLDFSILRKLLKDYSFKEVNEKTEHVHLSMGSFSDGARYKPEFYKQKSALKNVLDNIKPIHEKTKLFETIKKYIPYGVKHLPFTKILDKNDDKLFAGLGRQPLGENDDKYISKSGDKDIGQQLLTNNTTSNVYAVTAMTYIIKKINTESGDGVEVVSNLQEYNNAKQKLNLVHKPEHAIISQYITNPLLIDGKKFHIRSYFLISVQSGITKCFVHDRYKIFTAKEKYQQANWLNRDIHITHQKTTDKIYEWLSDEMIADVNLSNALTDSNLNKLKSELANCQKTLAEAMCLMGVKPYTESISGYHILGADLLITDDFNVYILEVNQRLGYGYGKDDDKYQPQFSKDLFQFILYSQILPYFGLSVEKKADAMINTGGTFSSYFGVISSFNLLPYTSASDANKQLASQIFYPKFNITKIIEMCPLNQIWLVMFINNNSNKDANKCIGYIGISYDNYIFIIITTAYQRRSIATTMIAKVIEIYRIRIFPNNVVIKMYKLNIAIESIAKKLYFNTVNTSVSASTGINAIYERNVIIDKFNTLCTSVNTSVMDLTYFKIGDVGLDYTILYKILDKYMTKVTRETFTHLSWGDFTQDYEIIQTSTGYSRDTKFIFQGSELKSALDSNKNKMIFTNFNEFVKLNYPENISYLLDPDLSNFSKPDNYVPFLLDNKKIVLRVYYLIYVSAGITRCFVYDDYTTFIPSNPSTDKTIKHPKFDEIKKLINIEKLNTIIKFISNCLISVNMKPYAESNSGFLIFCSNIVFDHTGTPYIKVIYDYIIFIIKNIYNDQFNQKYFNWITNSVIFPHFGIKCDTIICNASKNTNDGPLSSYYHTLNTLSIYFTSENELEIDNTIDGKTTKIGKILLKFSTCTSTNISSEIEIKHIELNSTSQNKKIGTASIAQLLEILAARTAPYNIMVFFISKLENMIKIAHNLHFHKQDDKFSRLCRV